MHPASVLGDITADAARDLRGRIGGIVETLRRGGLGNGQVADPRLDPRGAIERIDGEDAIQPGKNQQDPVGDRQRAAGQTGARAARHHRNASLMTEPQHRLDLFDVLRQDHQPGRLPDHRQAITLEGPQFLRFGQHRLGGQMPAETRREGRAIQGMANGFGGMNLVRHGRYPCNEKVANSRLRRPQPRVNENIQPRRNAPRSRTPAMMRFAADRRFGRTDRLRRPGHARPQKR